MADPERQLARDLARASDEQMTRIVALLDAMTAHGAADALIAPAPGRGASPGAIQKPSFGGVLFAPLDPVIVAGDGWKGEMCTLPSDGLAAIESVVRAGLGATVPVLVPLIEAALGRLDGCDSIAVGRVGAILWRRASDILMKAEDPPVPDAWIGAGLPARAFHPALRSVAAVLGAADEIGAWIVRAEADPKDDAGTSTRAARTMLAGALAVGAGPCGMLGAVLLARFPARGADILAAIAGLSRPDAGSDRRPDRAAARAAADLALETALDGLAGPTTTAIEAASLAEAARSARAAVSLLDGLGRDAGPRRRERLAADRADLDETCRVRFGDALASGVIAPLRAESDEGAGVRSAAAATELENTARDLRRFEQAARLLGGAGAYDAALRTAVAQVRALPGASGQALADRVRLVEILAGPEQALSLFALG